MSERCTTTVRNVVLALLAFVVAGCANRDEVQVALVSHVPAGESGLRVEVHAQVIGAQEGLSYKWYAVAGECEPQESDAPRTTFTFANNIPIDHVVVEVWREGRRVARGDIDLKFDAEMAARAELARPGDAKIEITKIPPWDIGGAETRDDIAGRVIGEVDEGWRVIVYARAYESWFIQPTAAAKHPIGANNTWTTWTHLGEHYAALLVTKDYVPITRLDMLPREGGAVLSRAIVEGSRADAKSP